MAWQRLAEIVGEYVTKGSKLYLEGKLQTTSWEDKQSGEKKYRTEIVAQELVLLDARGEGASDNGGGSKGRGRSKKVEAEMASTEIESSDIPF